MAQPEVLLPERQSRDENSLSRKFSIMTGLPSQLGNCHERHWIQAYRVYRRDSLYCWLWLIDPCRREFSHRDVWHNEQTSSSDWCRTSHRPAESDVEPCRGCQLGSRRRENLDSMRWRPRFVKSNRLSARKENRDERCYYSRLMSAKRTRNVSILLLSPKMKECVSD